MNKKIAVSLGYCSTILLTAQAAQAQTVAPVKAPVVADDARADIIVTAQKRSERLQDVPASISAVDAAQLLQRGQNSFADYATQIPGLSLTSRRPGFTQITLRGISTGALQASPSTSIYIDEAPIGSVNAYAAGTLLTPDLDPSDLARIEVLKGPQGTLYGAGAVGGIVKFVTTAPDTTRFSGRFEAGGSTVNGGGAGYVVRGELNVPLAEGLAAVRVGGYVRDDPGFIDNVANGAHDINGTRTRGARVALLLTPAHGLNISLSALGQNLDTDGTQVVDVAGATRVPVYGDLKQSRFTNEYGYANLRVYNGTVKYDAGPVQIVSATTYQTLRSATNADLSVAYGPFLGALFGVSNLGISAVQQTSTNRWSQELRFDTKLFDDRLDLQLGGYYTSEDSQNLVPGYATFSTVTRAAIPFPSLAKASILSSYEEYSLFGNATLRFTDRFDVLVGGRYSHNNQKYAQDYSGLLIGAPIVFQNTASADVGTFLVTPRFRLSDRSIVYVRIGSGYRPGGPNAVPPTNLVNAPLTFAADTLTSYEIGYKATLADGVVTLDTAIFHTDWRNIQITTSQGGFNFLVNGGSAKSQGAELSLAVRPMRGLALSGNVAYTNARLTADAPGAGGLDGDQQPFVPRWTWAINADYDWALSGKLRASVGASAGRVGDRQSDYAQRSPYTVPGYTTLDLRLGLALSGWSVSAYVRNVTNSRGITAYRSEGLSSGADPFGAAVIRPRTVGLNLAKAF